MKTWSRSPRRGVLALAVLLLIAVVPSMSQPAPPAGYQQTNLVSDVPGRAMVTDPTYAPAFAYAACWHSYRVGQGWSPDPGMDAAEAMRLASAAIERDSNDALALAYYGHFQSFLMRSFSTGADIIDRALAACPNLAVAWTMSSATLGYLDQGLEAILRAETGLRLSPLDPHVFWHEHVLSQAHALAGRKPSCRWQIERG